MEKKIIIGIFTLLVTVALSGCIESPNNNIYDDSKTHRVDNPYPDLVEVTRLNITTRWVNEWWEEDEIRRDQRPGFYHNFPSKGRTNYVVRGTIKMICPETTFCINVDIDFFDSEGNIIYNDWKYIGYFSTVGETKDFTYSWERPVYSNYYDFDRAQDYKVTINPRFD
jgi:hypothetical protein